MAKRAVLFANGVMPQAAQILPYLRPDDYFIAVDGGLRHLRNLYKTPGLLIGDLDSATTAEVEGAITQGIEVRRYKPDKNETDLELALLAAIEKGFDEILIIAALGGRLDQTLGNLNLLTQPLLTGVKVTIEDGAEEIFIIRDSAEISGQPGDVVSLIAMKGEVIGVETRDLKYPLRHETLYQEKSRGISNVMLGDQAGVSIESGLLLCVHTRKSGVEER
ncbi:MAG: thiamine diphosphokinase [Anaerolineaceae bacterium]